MVVNLNIMVICNGILALENVAAAVNWPSIFITLAPESYPWRSTWKVFHLGRLWPYPQAGKACQGQTLKLIIKSLNLLLQKVL
jgi:hypothetical protein